MRPANSLRRFGTIFFVTGSVVFVLLILERFLMLVSAFSGIVTICFLAWLLAFIVSPLVDGAANQLHLGRGIAVGLVYAGVPVLVGAQVAGIWGALFGLPVAAVLSMLANYVINIQAVQEVEGVDLLEVTTAIRAAYPEATPEEVLAEAADQAEAIYATQREERSVS